MTQQRVTKEKSKVKAVAETAGTPTTSDTAQKLAAEMDSMLDEIDGILEKNAQEFVEGFVQAGGQ